MATAVRVLVVCLAAAACHSGATGPDATGTPTQAEAVPAPGDGPEAAEGPARSATEPEPRGAPQGEPAEAAPPVEERSASVRLDVGPGRPVRGKLVDGAESTWVEVGLRAVVAPAAEPPRVLYSMRLCSEDGVTSGREREWCVDGVLRDVPADRSRTIVSGAPFLTFFEYGNGGEGWDVSGTAVEIAGGGVRFQLRGRRVWCTR